MSNNFVLDPMWITKKDYIDSEYFKYILMAAEQTYNKGICDKNNENFYEVLFHYLNLNNLVLDGNMFDFKMKPHWKNEKIARVADELYTFYKSHNESGETVKFANEIFKNICIKYLQHQTKMCDYNDCNIYYVNAKVHLLNDIYVLINIKGNSKYDIWKLKMDKRFVKGYKFTKSGSVEIEDLKDNALNEELLKLNNPALSKMNPDHSLMFCVITDVDAKIDTFANFIKNTILLNKLMANDVRFDPNLISNALEIILHEKILPFKLDEEFL